MNNSAYKNIIESILNIERKFKRKDHVKLIAVTKYQSIEQIRLLISQGQTEFGENYLQDALKKIKELGKENITWHFIGHIQSNKTKSISEHFDWVQSIDNQKVAIKLNTHRPNSLPQLNVLVQVNLNNEANKAGVHLDELESLCQKITLLPKLKLRGLMTMPKHNLDEQNQRENFRKFTEIYHKLQQNFQFDTLSMGTSHDYRCAIAEGSTMIRIGRALFS